MIFQSAIDVAVDHFATHDTLGPKLLEKTVVHMEIKDDKSPYENTVIFNH